MKIWVVGRNFPDKGNNGQGSFELEQAHMLAKRGNEVTYLACMLHPFYRIRGGGFVDFEDGDVKVFAYSGFFTPHMTNPAVPFPYFPKARDKKWRELLKNAGANGLPDVIHIHFPLFALSADVFEEYSKKGVKIVVTEHWTKVLLKRCDRYELSQMIRFLEFADTYSAVGYTLKKAIEETTGTSKEIVVIPNIINDAFTPSEEPHEGFRFGVAGRLAKVKQVDKIIEAFARDFKGRKDMSLKVIGGGREMKSLKKLAAAKGVADQVEFKGLLDRRQTADAVRDLDCLICFSRLETFGVPVIEAWGCGIPVITTTAGSITDRWDDRMGVSVSYIDMDALARAMNDMAEGNENYDREYIVREARSRYSEDIIYGLLMNIYKGGASDG